MRSLIAIRVCSAIALRLALCFLATSYSLVTIALILIVSSVKIYVLFVNLRTSSLENSIGFVRMIGNSLLILLSK